MAPTRPPSFFKIFLDPFCPHLPLPPDFVSKHLEDKIPENPILRSVSGGYSWRLKIQKVDECYCFVDGWNNVVEDAQLRFGDILVFWLADQSTFEVLVFTRNGCEKEFPSRFCIVLDDDDEAEEEIEEEEEEESDSESEVEEEDNDHDNGGGEEENDVINGGHDNDEDDPFFETVICKAHKFCLRLPVKFVRLAGLDAERIITMKNLDGKEWQMNLRSENTRKKRYYLSGWPKFRRVNDLSEGDQCFFKFIKSEDKLCLAEVIKAVKVPAAEVLKKPRGRPRRVEVLEGNVLSRETAGRVPSHVAVHSNVPVAKVLERKKGRPPRVEVDREDDGAKVVKRSRGRPPKRRRGRPAHVTHL